MSQLENTKTLLNSLIKKGYGQDSDPEIDVPAMLEWLESQHIPRAFHQLNTGMTFTTEKTGSTQYMKLDSGLAVVYENNGMGETKTFGPDDIVEVTSGSYQHHRVVDNSVNGENGIFYGSENVTLLSADLTLPAITVPRDGFEFSGGTFDIEVGNINPDKANSWAVNIYRANTEILIMNIPQFTEPQKTISGLPSNQRYLQMALFAYKDGVFVGHQRQSKMVINVDAPDGNNFGIGGN